MSFLPLAPALVLALALTVLLARPSVHLLTRLKARQVIREEGPQSHHAKAGTPSMGGLFFVPAALLACVPFMQADPILIGAIVLIVGFMLVGFADDFLSIRKHHNKGLSARQKLLFQFALGTAFASWLWLNHHQTWVWLPIAHQPYDLGWTYWPFLVLVIVGATNATNLTDGLDGLAATTGAIAMAGLAALVMHWGAPAMHPGLLAMPLAFTGACAGFLWVNAHPAQVFMGDTGSLGLGAALVAIAATSHLELYLLPLGILFVAEALSVILQVSYFRSTGGKRIFRMSPIHHHFELGGLAETKVVARFALVGLLAALVTVIWL
ncbi:MAG: phospho-N-acetylmuramoyl-pentapeptide-transferase [Cyanobacteria bacterium REEB65]|nr:phospho-N-acetylmuramoyl-pentapeptide-transferase [Cyanobacteria bacterium REEB65]